MGYDAMGHRISKAVKPRDGSNALKGEKDWNYTFYTLDAQGNVMATYERVIEETSSGSGLYNVKWRLKEQYIYGSQRIGQRSTTVEEKVISLGTLSTSTVAHFRDNTNETKINWASYTLTLPTYTDAHEANYNADIGVTPHKVYTAKRKLGEKSYELSNHLGNVLEVISDRRKSVDANTYTSTGTLSSAVADTKVDYYYADVLAYNDYFPFGMLIPGRNGVNSGVNARFGFQGQERDDEMKGPGNSVNFEYRMHDPRIGRFFGPDPLEKQFVWNSTYAFSANRVIDAVELEGCEFKFVTLYLAQYADGTTYIEKADVDIIKDWVLDFSDIGLGKFAHTIVRYSYDGKIIYYEEFDEPIKEGGLTPSAAYDYTQDEIDGKFTEDWDYMINGESGNFVDRLTEIIFRDQIAPEQQVTIQDFEVLAALPVIMPIGGFKTPRENIDYALKRQGHDGLDSYGNKKFRERWSDNEYDYEYRINRRDDGSKYYRIGRKSKERDENGQGKGMEYQDENGNWHFEKDLKKLGDDKGTHHNIE